MELNDEEVEGLMATVEAGAGCSAANFVYELPGNLWYVAPSAFGWRRQAREWGQAQGLVQHEIVGGEGRELTYVVLTQRGEAFKAALIKRGITIFAPQEESVSL